MYLNLKLASLKPFKLIKYFCVTVTAQYKIIKIYIWIIVVKANGHSGVAQLCATISVIGIIVFQLLKA